MDDEEQQQQLIRVGLPETAIVLHAVFLFKQILKEKGEGAITDFWCEEFFPT